MGRMVRRAIMKLPSVTMIVIVSLLSIGNLFHRQRPMTARIHKTLRVVMETPTAHPQSPRGTDPHHILPETLYVIYGLESSGTTFMTRTIAQAVGIIKFLNGDTIESVDSKILVQHLSLPLGSAASFKNVYGYHQRFESLDVIDVFYPRKCHVRPNQLGPPDWKETPEECKPFLGGQVIAPPLRYFVNITSHVQWYRNHGVVVKPILVVRDPSLHFEGILRQHCENVTAALDQYETGKAIIAQTLSDIDPLIVSYETLMTLHEAYLQSHVYRKLGILSNYTPVFKNGNLKYSPKNNITSIMIEEEKEKRRKAENDSTLDEMEGRTYDAMIERRKRIQEVIRQQKSNDEG
jgi:hypothetical protein